jgi:hypothetical protein
MSIYDLLEKELTRVMLSGYKEKFIIIYSTSIDSNGRQFYCDVEDEFGFKVISGNGSSFDEATQRAYETINIDWAIVHGYSLEK